MGKPAAFLFCLGVVAAGVVGCGVKKPTGIEIGIGDSGGAGGSAGTGGLGGGGAGGASGNHGGAAGGVGGVGGQGGLAAGGAAGNGAGGFGGAAPPVDCVPAVSVAADGGPQPFARCLFGATPTPEVCDDPTMPCHCPLAYATLSACGCFVHDIDQECPSTGVGGAAGTASE